jgi:DNA-binding transcriptional ArsR family regulator
MSAGTAGSSHPEDPPLIREVDNPEGLKALADPTRLAILTRLMSGSELPVMSVKELAAELGEPQTKLYRHIKVLESAGLIRVAASRLVSGILEQRYQACQRDVRFGPGFLREYADDSERVARTVIDRFRDGFFAAFRAGLLPTDADVPADQPYRKSTILMSEQRMPKAKAAQLRQKIQELAEFVDAEPREDPDGVPVHLLLGYYSLDDDAGL